MITIYDIEQHNNIIKYICGDKRCDVLTWLQSIKKDDQSAIAEIGDWSFCITIVQY
jgi:hypothetical protein